MTTQLSERLLDVVVAAIAALPIQQFVQDVSEQVDYAFIDEIFHFPQLKIILSGDYQTWDPKITTPPGLYYLTALYSKVFNIECTLANVRYFNYIGGVFITLLAILIRNKIPQPGFTSAAILLNPLLTIFYSLYYTDVWSSAIIILGLTVVIWRPNNNYILTSIVSALIGLISLTFRQTNIAWCVFLLVVLIDAKVKDEKLYNYQAGYQDVLTFIKTSLKNFGILIPYIIVGLSFVGFVYVNGGIALGDKENHILVPHLAQLCYCVTFITVFTMPLWISFTTIFDYLEDNFFNIQGLIFNLAWIPVLFITIQGFTIIHPFVLADNRHYVFYIVKNFILRTETSRYELLPVYHLSFYIIYKLFKDSSNNNNDDDKKRTIASPIVFYAFMFCTAISVILSPLFEPRYYIIPYIIFRLYVKPTNAPLINLEFLYTHNVKLRYVGEILWLWFWTQAVYLVFLQFTFQWPDQIDNVQRIIW
jgi:alpha-1,2-glucosyltransferase